LTEEIREENKNTTKSDYNNSKRILGQVVTIIYFVIITLIYHFLLFDGILWPNIMSWGALAIFTYLLIIDPIVGSIIRTTIFIVDNFLKTIVFIIINMIFCLVLIGSAVFIFLNQYPLMPIPVLLFFLYPFIISLPINLTLLINRETFLIWFRWSSNKVILTKRTIRVKQISSIIFSITFLTSISATILFTWFFSYYFLISIVCYYGWFIFFELIWKRITLMKKSDN